MISENEVTTEKEVKTEDRVEQIAKSILDIINQLTDGDAMGKQYIVLQLIQKLYKERCPNIRINECLDYLHESDFLVLAYLLEGLISTRVRDEIDADYSYAYFNDK